MHKIVYLVLGVLVAAGATAVGCGDSGSGSGGSGTGASGGSGPGSGGGTQSGGGTTTTPSTSTNSGGGGGSTLSLTCADYCTEVLADCTTADNDSQYPDLAAAGSPHDVCMAVCASFPKGSLADTSGDTLGCRIYHAGNSPSTTHCWHGGPTGGDGDNTDANPGLCGEGCEAFCNLEEVACTGGNQQYASKDACMTACAAFPVPTAASYDAVSAATGHDFFCYMYHLNAASVDPGTHCIHTKVGASPCDPPQP